MSSLPFRTVIQGLLTDILVAVAFVVYDAMSNDVVDWRFLLITLGKTALMTAASYIMKNVRPPTTPPG